MSPSVDEVRGAARTVFARHPGVRVALLFGSLARGAARPDSDIDVAVVGTGADLSTCASELSVQLGREVDVVSLDSDPPVPLVRELLRDAVCVYEAEPGAEATLRSRLLWTLETDGPMIDALARRYLEHLAARARP
ncbi:MAG TPA: nucleotidyltransferase domain-containing protein [Polyangiales bacterium]